MELKEGDLVITLPKVEKIRAIIDRLEENKVGVITSINAKFGEKSVYGVLIGGQTYFLFEDEIQKLEEEC